ncbi:holo-ACP synthase [Nitratifractor sp.]
MINVGTDLVSIARIREAYDRFGERFFQRYLHPDESSGKRLETLAGYWAAKEAIAKALGCGIGAELSFHDIRLRHDAKGAPSFTLSKSALRRFPMRDASLSISHDGGFALAVVIIVLDTRDTPLS